MNDASAELNIQGIRYKAVRDPLKTGGHNLYPGYKEVSFSYNTDKDNYVYLDPIIDVVIGDYYTVSAIIEGALLINGVHSTVLTDSHVSLWFVGMEGTTNMVHNITAPDHVVTLPSGHLKGFWRFKIPDTYTEGRMRIRINFYTAKTYVVRELMLEHSYWWSDYSPADEDIQNWISDGTCLNSNKLGGQSPSYYLASSYNLWETISS